jgi:hypothetical protein
MCVPLPHEQDTNSADTAYEIVCLRILGLCNRTGAMPLEVPSPEQGLDDTGLVAEREMRAECARRRKVGPYDVFGVLLVRNKAVNRCDFAVTAGVENV